MLERLTIQNIALIERADVEFSAGLNVLSGETGAGKSVILDSIDFVLGAKADKSMIRYGAEDCFVRAEFRTQGNSEISLVLKDLEIDEDELLVITRRFSMDGKSSVKVNGCSVTISMLRRLTSFLVDVHGQSEHFYLLKESNQLRLLDKIAGDEVQVAKGEVAQLLADRKKILGELSVLGGDEGERNRRLDILRFQIGEIENAALRDGEEEELLALRDKIAHSEKILDGLRTAAQFLLADGGGTDSLNGALRSFSAISRFGDEFSALAERTETLAAELEDIAEEAERRASECEFDEREAERVEARLDEIRALKKKYGKDLPQIRAFYEKAKTEAELLSDSGEKCEKLNAELNKTEDRLYAACVALSDLRKRAAKSFTERVTEQLKTLNIGAAKFEIEFMGFTRGDVAGANSEGLDRIRFLFSANAGEPVKELGKIISGGEMSRFMLAIKAQLSSLNEIGTYLFDEIDAGISGKTARVVAEKFCSIAKKTQIIAVSHLAQIAAAADAQFLIEKTQTADKTFTTIRPLDSEGRLREIARLLGGDSDSEFAGKHAAELVKSAEIYKNSLK